MRVRVRVRVRARARVRARVRARARVNFGSRTIDVASETKPPEAGQAVKSCSLNERTSIASAFCLGTRSIEIMTLTRPASCSPAPPSTGVHSLLSPGFIPASEKKAMPKRTSLSLGCRLWW